MDLNSLRCRWTVDDSTALCRIIYDAIPIKQHPDWAGAILLYAAGDEPLCVELARVVDLSFDDRKWIEARGAFQAVRQLTCQNVKLNKLDSWQQLILDIGETAAKVIYNASGGSAPFDYHAGWLMAPRVKKLAEYIGQQKFEDDCWQLLIRSQIE